MSNLYARIIRFLNNRKKNPEMQWEQGCTYSVVPLYSCNTAKGGRENTKQKFKLIFGGTRSSDSKVVAVNASQSN